MPEKHEVDNRSTNLQWINISFFPHFLHPDLKNVTFPTPDQIKNNTNLNMTYIMHQYIQHNERKKIVLYNDSDSPCTTKKRIILDVSRSGLGNRMLALSSAVILSIMTGRTLELKWEKTEACLSEYGALFHPKKENGPYYPFVFSKFRPYRSSKRIESRCYIHLTQLSYAHLSLLSEEALFRKLNQDCHVLYIESNQYYANILLTQQFNYKSKHVKTLFSKPFKDIAKIAFDPVKKIHQKINSIKSEFYSKGKVWMAMHVRGYFLAEKGMVWAMECANSLLERGYIHHLLLVTDSDKSKLLVQSLIDKRFKGSLVIPKKIFVNDLVNRTDSMSLRDDMDQAVAEWYLIGEADYCISPTIEQSTFSSTSIARGDCRYIDYRTRGACQLPKESTDNERLLYEHNTHLTTDIKPLNSVKREELWQSVVRTENEYIDEQCFDYNDPYNNENTVLAGMLAYWLKDYYDIYRS
jgi:hypothetical protein